MSFLTIWTQLRACSRYFVQTVIYQAAIWNLVIISSTMPLQLTEQRLYSDSKTARVSLANPITMQTGSSTVSIRGTHVHFTQTRRTAGQRGIFSLVKTSCLGFNGGWIMRTRHFGYNWQLNHNLIWPKAAMDFCCWFFFFLSGNLKLFGIVVMSVGL